MRALQQQLARNPALPRVVPFATFLLLTSLQGQFGEESRYWFYLAKTIVGAWMIWVVRRMVAELRWAFSVEAVVVGAGVFGLWVGLDGFYPSLDQLLAKVGIKSSNPVTAWNPHAHFGEGALLAWAFIVVRIVGSTVVVPPLEEVFYRSFLYRWIAKPDFESVPMRQFNGKAFVLTSLIFGFTHQQWLAGVLCGMAYQWLVIRKNRLGDALTAHAITNLLLAFWVVWRGAWNFW